MNDLVGGLGSAIEGALVSKAVEPGHGESDHATHAAEACANCGTVGSSPYCGECGQKRHVHRTLSAIGHDIIHGVLHLDGKLWNTLPLLIFKPGKLTRRYIEGERAKFVSPMAMFLFTVFAMFAVFQMVGLSVPTNLSGDGVITDAMGDVRLQAEQAREEAKREVATAPEGSPARREAEMRLAEVEEDLANMNNAQQSLGGADVEFDATLTGIEVIDKGIVKKWRENPSLMLYKLQSNGYKFSWLLIPLSIPFMWLLFAWRRQYKAYDHAVFVTYSLSFTSLLLIVMSLINLLPGGSDWALLLFVTAGPLHFYKQLRYAYGLSRFSALWRFAVLLVLTQIIMVLFLLILGVLGAF